MYQQSQGPQQNPFAQPPPQYSNPPPYGQPSQPPYGQPPYGQPSQPPYGQPPYGPPSQPPYGQPYGPPQSQGPYQPPIQPSYGGGPQPPYNQAPIPDFKLIGRGNGIDEREFYVITHAAFDALNMKEDPLSNGITKRIKKDLGGEWMAFASIEGLKGYDFSLSIVTGNDFLSFTIKNFRFQVCRLRD